MLNAGQARAQRGEIIDAMCFAEGFVDVAGGVALGVALLTALPKQAPGPVLRAAKPLRASTLALQKAWAATKEVDGATVDRRDADHRMDIAWSSLYGRLETYAALPADAYPRAGEAADLFATIFPDGLRFLRLPYAREWAESNRLLTLIQDKKLETKLRSLIGEDFLGEVKAAHDAYGQALGITEAQPPADVAGVQAPLRDLQAAVRSYGTQVVAAADDSPAFVDSARAALAPIDQLRAATTTRSASPAPARAPAPAPAPAPAAPPAPAPKPAAASPLPPVTPTSPVPAVPDA